MYDKCLSNSSRCSHITVTKKTWYLIFFYDSYKTNLVQLFIQSDKNITSAYEESGVSSGADIKVDIQLHVSSLPTVYIGLYVYLDL